MFTKQKSSAKLLNVRFINFQTVDVAGMEAWNSNIPKVDFATWFIILLLGISIFSKYKKKNIDDAITIGLLYANIL